MSNSGVRLGPGRNAAAVGDDSYHSNAVPHRKRVLAWIDVSNGYQHDSVSHAVAVMERLGYETGAYDLFIRSDSHAITKSTVRGSDGQPLLYAKNLNDFDAIFFFGVREIDLTDEQKADLLAFVHDDGKGFVEAHAGATAFFSWPEFGKMIGGRFDEHPWGVVEAPVIVEDHSFPGLEHLPASFMHVDEFYQIKDFSRTYCCGWMFRSCQWWGTRWYTTVARTFHWRGQRAMERAASFIQRSGMTQATGMSERCRSRTIRRCCGR